MKTKVRINYKLNKLFPHVRGNARTILWQLQEKNEGTIKVHPSICARNRQLIKKKIEKLSTLTIDVLEKKEGSKGAQFVKKPLFAIDGKTQEACISYARGMITYEFSPQVQAILATKQYFTIDLDAYTKLRSQRSKLFYELLRKFQNTGKIGQFGTHFKEALGLYNRRYRSAAFFQASVLDPLIEEIEQKTSFRLNRREDGSVAISIGKFVYFCFSKVGEQSQEDVQETIQYTSVYERLLQKGIPARQASLAVQKLGEHYINRLIYAVELDKSDKKIENKLKVLLSKISTALELMQAHAHKKKKTLYRLKNACPKGKPLSPSKQKEKRKKQKLITIFKENKGVERICDLLSSMQIQTTNPTYHVRTKQ